MKILTMIYRWFTCKCIHCGAKKMMVKRFDHPYLLGCTTAKHCPNGGPIDLDGTVQEKFISHKEARVQRALGLLK